jgi:succinate-acetate transporter protein
VLESVRSMPAGVRLFVAYGLVVLALIGLALPGVVAMAVEVPVTGPGVILMLLLAYTVFTMTLVLQRKRAAFWLAVGLSSLTVPLILLFVLGGLPLAAIACAALAAGLFLGLRTAATRRYFDQE